jgi:N-acetylmuramic acid 6-phosphate etherase
VKPQLDSLPTAEVVRLMLTAESRVVPAVSERTEAVVAAAELLAQHWRAGGRLVFAGAGTSGRMAAAEAAELPGTFGLDRDRVLARVAGGSMSTDSAEDDLDAAQRDSTDIAFTAADVLIAVAASGSTPYTLALADAARTAGAAVVAVTNVAASSLADRADVSVAVTVGPEVLRDSTRLTAGTAQKITLNAITTAAMVRAGRVHGDLMVDVRPANAKLRIRAAGIVAELTGCDEQQASDALAACDGNARAAVLHLLRGLDPVAAIDAALQHESLRVALDTKVV